MRHLALFLVLALTLSGCTKVAEQTAGGRHPWTVPGVVRIGSPEEPDNLNNMYAHSAATDEMQNLLFAPVFRLDDHGRLTPELGLEVPSLQNGLITKDGKTITVHFRKGVVWADGTPLTARDFRFTWRAVMNPRNNTKARYGWEEISAIDLPDDHTAVIHLRRPYAPFVVGVLSSGGYPPLPEHLLGKLADLNRAAFNSNPLSSGPWILQRWNHGASLEFEPNPKYWRGPPKLKHLTWKIIPNAETQFNQLETHEIDVYPNVAVSQIARLGALQGMTITKTLLANERHVTFNCRRPVLADVRVRRAIAEGVDWDRINAKVYRNINVRATSDILPGSWAAPSIPPFKHDVEDAKQLLERAGWKLGLDGVRHKAGSALRIGFQTTTGHPDNDQTALQIQSDLRAVGIDVEIKQHPSSLFFAQNGPLYTGKFDLSWSIDTYGPDPDNSGSNSGEYIPPKGANTSFLDDALITRLDREALLTFDQAKRKALYQQEQQRIHELVPYVYVYWEVARHAFNSDLKNYKPAQYISDNWNSWEWEI